MYDRFSLIREWFDLVLGYYSVHTTSAALQGGEAHIAAIRAGAS
ncbi:hypothetical protein [Glaciimonas sp. PCH181]|nr:hypothetical protein [Glaciimonas sp. PCH181]